MNSYKSSCTPKTISKATQHLQKKKKGKPLPLSEMERR